MKVSDFDYILPEELIAQTPLKNRSASRLLVINKNTGNIKHDHFLNIIDYLNEGDVLVLNDTSVIPARLFGFKEDTLAAIEILLLKQREDDVWECLVKKARKIKVGTTVIFGNGLLKAKCIKVYEEGLRDFEMIYNGVFYEIIDQLGEMPLPPYIHEKLLDQDRYQTVYNKFRGSAAAPTAGLHFTKNLLKRITEKRVKIVYVTLHVGLGTFRPVQVETIEDHHMHTEYYQMTDKCANTLNKAKQENRRIIAVGTTSLRTLETILRDYDDFRETSGWSDIFIFPGYSFKAVDALITNFHLPKSTLLMLVSALAGRNNIINAYNEAIEEKYRFFSFGDSMLIKG
ncbi:MAG: tRNA preQ1(34) S-adenosylmethionine ribosyltransferase-isomerase QueA [Candidatus Izimaplasma sp.]|nr:tRNA preQ1(34) S-adenosylmethionine ribosyltransferase-isomerase QueA [Candidatus Izimaplasma bacterium]